MKNYLKWIGMALLSVASLACQEDIHNPELPRITQFGANTIGFKVNGKNWVPRKESGWSDPAIKMGINAYSKDMGINCSRTIDKNRDYFSMNLKKVIEEKEYFELITERDGISFSAHESGSGRYFINLDEIGSIYITKLDTANKIVSGQFYFTVTSYSGQSLKITDGRFDFNYPFSN